MSEKTEQPTAQRLKEARAKGQIPRSRLFCASAVTFAVLAALAVRGPTMAGQLGALAVHLFSAPQVSSGAALKEALEVLVRCVLPLLLCAGIAAVGAGVASAGFAFHPELLKPKGERVDPFAGFKRVVSLKQLWEVAKAVVVALVVGLVLWSLLREHAGTALRAVQLPGGPALQGLLELLLGAVLRAGAVLAALGCADFLLARRRHRRELMMTREEVKQEHKSNEGDPHHKQKRRSLHRQLAQGGPARGVQNATAIVVNPTHIAVALRYSPEECDAPYLVAKGREQDAFALRRAAQALGIPIIRDVPLARALVHYDVGEEVPDELYRAAAAVLRTALELDTHPRSRTSC